VATNTRFDPTLRLVGVGIGTFLLVGVGIGIAGYFSIDAFSTGGDGFGAQLVRAVFVIVSVVVTALVGAPVAATVGAHAADSEAPPLRAYAATAGSSLVGHLLMFVVATLIISAQLSAQSGDGGGGGIDLGQFLGPMVLAAVGVSITGVGVAVLVRRAG
jgi:uncharacterized membrane protein